jgi:glucose dehydrogenase
MSCPRFFFVASLLPSLMFGQGQGVKPEDLLKPLKDSWPTYNGDYSGKRYSALKQVNRTNVQHLTLAWSMRFTSGKDEPQAGRRRGRGLQEKLIVGGEGPGDIAIRGGTIKASVLEADGTLYFTMPDNAWAVDARDGHTLWHYFWKTKGGTHIGNRGLAIWNDCLYMETPDDYLVSLDAKTGNERWHKMIADVDQGYFSTPAPTCSLVALNVDTGNMAWYFQTSPHDMHDYDSAQTPILVDGMFNGKMRKLVLTAARNGYFFVVDRTTGEHLLTTKYGEQTNWAEGLNQLGGPKRNPEKDATVGGSLVSPTSGGTINWQPPAYSPDTGLFYVAEKNGYSMFYLTDTDPRGSMGLGGKQEDEVGSAGAYLTAIDYRTGKAAWRRSYYGDSGGGGGLLTTAGGLLFAGDGSGNLIAHDVTDGKPLWHTRIGSVSNPPQTYILDGHQYVIAAAGDTLWSFVLY